MSSAAVVILLQASRTHILVRPDPDWLPCPLPLLPAFIRPGGLEYGDKGRTSPAVLIFNEFSYGSFHMPSMVRACNSVEINISLPVHHLCFCFVRNCALMAGARRICIIPTPIIRLDTGGVLLTSILSVAGRLSSSSCQGPTPTQMPGSIRLYGGQEPRHGKLLWSVASDGAVSQNELVRWVSYTR